jgi:hypothetical protein
MNRVSLGHEEIMDSKGKDRESGSEEALLFAKIKGLYF